MLQVCAETEGDKLHLGEVGFHIRLNEKVVRQAVTKDNLRIEPAVGIARAACIEQVVGIENALVRDTS